MNHFRTHYTYLSSFSLHTPLSAGSDAAVVVVHTVLLNRKEIKIAMISLKMDDDMSSMWNKKPKFVDDVDVAEGKS